MLRKRILHLLLSPDAADGGAVGTAQPDAGQTSTTNAGGSGVPGVDTSSDPVTTDAETLDIFEPAADAGTGGAADGGQQTSINGGQTGLQQQQQTQQVQQSATAGVTSNGRPQTGATAQPQGGGQQASGTAQPQVSTTLTKDDIAQILSQAGLAQQQAPRQAPVVQQPQQPQRQYTQDELDKMFNVWKPDAALMQRLQSGDPAAAIQALTEMRDGMMKQAMTMAEFRLQQYQQNIVDQHLAPLTEYVSTQQANDFRNDFFAQHEDLQPYEQLVDAVAAKLASSGWRGASRADTIAKFADETRTVLKTLLPANGAQGGQQQPAAAGQQQQPAQQVQSPSQGQRQAAPAGQGRRMSTLSGGGQGGTSRPGGAGQGAQQRGPSGIEVFDD